jgi:hypothetical protein
MFNRFNLSCNAFVIHAFKISDKPVEHFFIILIQEKWTVNAEILAVIGPDLNFKIHPDVIKSTKERTKGENCNFSLIRDVHYIININTVKNTIVFRYAKIMANNRILGGVGEHFMKKHW